MVVIFAWFMVPLNDPMAQESYIGILRWGATLPNNVKPVGFLWSFRP